MSEEVKEDEPRGLYERLKSDDDSWELWAKLGVAVLSLQLVAFVVAFLSLGEASVIAHSVMISLFGIMTMPLMFWGLFRTLFRPPVWRMSRTIAFLSLLLAGYLGNVSLFPAPVSTGDWTSDQAYTLPFDGEWVTLAGGDDRKHNYHLTTMAHRWGYDFAPVIDGSRYEGDGSKIEDHHCYGTPVRAPVSGEVVRSLGAEQDHPPGEYDPNQILGNYIIMRVDTDEYLFMAHLRQGSLEVGSGDDVQAGDKVAECGNSGRSSTPHLHIHLQNTQKFPLAESLPLRFSDYVADGEEVDLGMPLGSRDYDAADGQVVANQRAWPVEKVEKPVVEVEENLADEDPDISDEVSQIVDAASDRAAAEVAEDEMEAGEE